MGLYYGVFFHSNNEKRIYSLNKPAANLCIQLTALCEMDIVECVFKLSELFQFVYVFKNRFIIFYDMISLSNFFKLEVLINPKI